MPQDFFGWVIWILGTVVLGAIGGIGVQNWRATRDDLKEVFGALCELVNEAADEGCSYWQKPGSDEGRELNEATLMSLQKQMGRYSSIIQRIANRKVSAQVEEGLALFFDALTGGQFSEPDRPANPMRAKRVRAASANAIIEIREAFFVQVRPMAFMRGI